MSKAIESENNIRWPGSSILIWGTFGAQSPEGRRYQRRCTIALVLMLAAFLISAATPEAVGRIIRAAAPGVAFTFIAWELRRYLLALDELARKIQLEAIAGAYLAAMALASISGGFMLAYRLDTSFLNPLWFFWLEPLRGVVLYLLARRY